MVINMIEIVLFALGLCEILKVLFTLFNNIKPLFLSKEPKLTPGTWAIITACTDGIGKGFSESFAKRGLNIIQVGRNSSKLAECAKDLNIKYGVEVKSIVKDFSLSHLNPIHFFQDIYDQTKGLDIRILVNNVGTGTFSEFIKQPHQDIQIHMSLNVFPIVFLTRLYERDIRTKENSWIINLSSVYAESLLKGLICYNSTKMFDKNFTEVLISENSHAMVLQPGWVDTPLTAKVPDRTLLVSVEECCESTVKNLGVVNVTYGHWKHVIWMYIFTSVTFFRIF
jgi:short-subunit dehydrogenase